MLLYEHKNLENFLTILTICSNQFPQNEVIFLLTKNKHNNQNTKTQTLSLSLRKTHFNAPKLVKKKKKSSYKDIWIIVDNQFHTSSK